MMIDVRDEICGGGGGKNALGRTDDGWMGERARAVSASGSFSPSYFPHIVVAWLVARFLGAAGWLNIHLCGENTELLRIKSKCQI